MGRPKGGKKTIVAHDAPLMWRDEVEIALKLLFAGRKSHVEIATEVGISTSQLRVWITHPDFQQRLHALRADLENTLIDMGVPYVDKGARIIALSQMAEAARVEFESHPTVVERKQIGRDGEGRPIWQENEFFNRDAHESFRGAVADIAKELGHRVTKAEVTGKDGGPIATVDITDEIRRRLAGIAAATSTREIPAIIDAGTGEDPAL